MCCDQCRYLNKTRPRPYPAATQPWGNEWHTSASTPDGWKRCTCRRTATATELDAIIPIADAEWAEQEVRRADSQPGAGALGGWRTGR